MVLHYFGYPDLIFWGASNVIFNSGTAYILSRSSLQRVAPVLRSMPKGTVKTYCVDRDGPGEDLTMGVCLRMVGIQPDNTLDEFGRRRFLTFQYEAHLRQKRDDEKSWYWIHQPAVVRGGAWCCVPDHELISVHQYKRENSDPQYWDLHRRAIAPVNPDLYQVPPVSSYFWHADNLSFKIDEYLNCIEPNCIKYGPPHWKGFNNSQW